MDGGDTTEGLDQLMAATARQNGMGPSRAAAIFGSGTKQAETPAPAVDIVGTWHLAGCSMIYANGKTSRPWGGSVSGYLLCAPDGHLSETLSYPGQTGTIRTHTRCGAYEIAGDVLHHHVSASADIDDIGTVRSAQITLESGVLNVSFQPAPGGGAGSKLEFVWRRAAAVGQTGSSTPRALT